MVTTAVLRGVVTPGVIGVSVTLNVRLPSCLTLARVSTLNDSVRTPGLNVRVPALAV